MSTDGVGPNVKLPDLRVAGPPPDIFDLPPPPQFTEPQSSPLSATAQPKGLLTPSVVGVASVLLVAALLFRFPVPICIGFAAAGAICQLARHHNWLYRFLWTVILAAFSAEMTSIFITPFTFPLRFIFFFVLIGLLVAYIGSQLDTM